jgi:hypothetical protein
MIYKGFKSTVCKIGSVNKMQTVQDIDFTGQSHYGKLQVSSLRPGQTEIRHAP